MRRRLFAYLLAAAVASVALTVGVALVLNHRAERRQVRDTLRRQADAVASTFALQGAPIGGGSGLRVFVLRGGRVATPKPARERALRQRLGSGGEDREGTLSLGGAQLAYVVRATSSGSFAVVRAAAPQSGDVAGLGGTLIIAGAGGALLAALLAGLLAPRLIGPVRELTAATRPVAEGRAGVRVPVRGDDELAELARAFNAMADELVRAQAAERRFLAAVSHELRTPLTGVRGYAEALRDGAVGPAEAGAAITRESARLERLVADLLTLARTRAADFAVEHEALDLGDIAEEVRARHAVSARARSVHVELGREAAAGAVGDHDRVVQALSNLVDNALRLSPPGATVRVEAAPGRLRVLDEGPGLTAEEAAHAFRPLWLAERRGRAEAGGAGLGLAIVAGLATAMGGEATAAPRPEGRGAAFTVRLPTR